MKNLILFFCLFSMSQTILAQEDTDTMPSNYFVGGLFNYSSSSNSATSQSYDRKSITFRFSPYVGKAINPKLSVGLYLGYSYTNDITKYDVGNDSERKTTQYGVGLFTRHHLNPSNKLVFFLQPNVSYEAVKVDSKLTSSSSIRKGHFLGAGASAGAIYNITHHFRAVLSMGLLQYSIRTINDDISNGTTTDYSYFEAGISLNSINVGFEYKF